MEEISKIIREIWENRELRIIARQMIILYIGIIIADKMLNIAKNLVMEIKNERREQKTNNTTK